MIHIDIKFKIKLLTIFVIVATCRGLLDDFKQALGSKLWRYKILQARRSAAKNPL